MLLIEKRPLPKEKELAIKEKVHQVAEGQVEAVREVEEDQEAVVQVAVVVEDQEVLVPLAVVAVQAEADQVKKAEEARVVAGRGK